MGTLSLPLSFTLSHTHSAYPSLPLFLYLSSQYSLSPSHSCCAVYCKWDPSSTFLLFPSLSPSPSTPLSLPLSLSPHLSLSLCHVGAAGLVCPCSAGEDKCGYGEQRTSSISARERSEWRGEVLQLRTEEKRGGEGRGAWDL